MAQQMPLPLTISCSSKSRLVLPFWYLLTRVVPDKFQKSSKTIVLCVCVLSKYCNMFLCVSIAKPVVNNCCSQVFLLKSSSSCPLITAVVNMFVSEPLLD